MASTPDPEGVVSGAVLRLAREQLRFTQERAAEVLGVDLNTIKGWESGRRPLARASYLRVRAVTSTFRRLGVSETLLGQLDTAVDVDLAIGQLLRGDRDNPLGSAVHTRQWHDLLAAGLADANGSVPRPRLAPADRARVFDNLRDSADRAVGDSPADSLLRRQAAFVLTWDRSPAGRDWLTKAQAREARRARVGVWSPAWVAGRSLAVARAVQGDREVLRRFIETQMASDQQNAANLNYWAHWVGESRTAPLTDEFMVGDLGPWRGAELLRHLVAGLAPSTAYIDLTVHSVWALLARRPNLLDTALAAELETRLALLIAAGCLSPQAKREAEQLTYATTLRRSA